jgi:hypothetical protein
MRRAVLSHHGGVLPSVPHRPLRKVDLGAQGKTRQGKARQDKTRQDKTGAWEHDDADRQRGQIQSARLPAPARLPGTMGG